MRSVGVNACDGRRDKNSRDDPPEGLDVGNWGEVNG